MAQSILVTGAAGYIGGSLIASLLACETLHISRDRISAAVRSDEQAKALVNLGINILQLDLSNEEAVIRSILDNDVSIVVHTASSIDPGVATNLITALSKQKEVSKQEVHFIHTSGLSAFYEKTGWPSETMKDTDPIFETEKRLADSFAIRETDVTAIEHAKALGVTSYVVVPSTVYGKGSGQWNKLSVVLPVLVKASISQKRVYRFPDETKVSGVHISDLTALYMRIIEKITYGEVIPSGAEGYYFALAHEVVWQQALDHLATALHACGLVSSPETRIWPSDEFAAKALGVPTQFLQPLWNAGENVTCQRAYDIGWKPIWDADQFLKNMNNEIEAVLELDKAKSSLISSLFEAAKKC